MPGCLRVEESEQPHIDLPQRHGQRAVRELHPAPRNGQRVPPRRHRRRTEHGAAEAERLEGVGGRRHEPARLGGDRVHVHAEGTPAGRRQATHAQHREQRPQRRAGRLERAPGSIERGGGAPELGRLRERKRQDEGRPSRDQRRAPRSGWHHHRRVGLAVPDGHLCAPHRLHGRPRVRRTARSRA